MQVKAFLNSRFSTTHENQIFDELLKRLKERWNDSDESVILLGNFFYNNRDIDAMLIKRDAIIVVDFKDYGGQLRFSENSIWKIGDINVKGGAFVNPFMQVRSSKSLISNFFKENTENIFKTANKKIAFNDIYGLILFHRHIELLNPLPGEVKKWFYISDIDNICQTFHQITNSNLNLSDDEIQRIPSLLGLQEYQLFQSKGIALERVKEKNNGGNGLDELLFSLLTLKEELEAKDILKNKFDIFRKKHERLISHFQFAATERLLIGNLTKVQQFDKEISEFKIHIENEILSKIESVLNCNANANLILDELSNLKVTKEQLGNVKNVNSLINRLQKKTISKIEFSKINLTKLKAIELFTYNRGIFSNSSLEIISAEIQKVESIKKYFHALFEILRTWFSEDSIQHWRDGMVCSIKGIDLEMQSNFRDEVQNYIRNNGIFINGENKIEFSPEDETNPYISDDPLTEYLLTNIAQRAIWDFLKIFAKREKVNNKISLTIIRDRTEHLFARGFSIEWFKYFKRKFEEPQLTFVSIKSENNIIPEIIIEVEIPTRIRRVFLSILTELKKHLTENELNSLLNFFKLSWIERDKLKLEDIYLIELKTKLIFNLSADSNILNSVFHSANTAIFEPTYICMLEATFGWGYGKITTEEVLKSSIEYLDNDLKSEIKEIIHLWHDYKPAYNNKGNYHSSNVISFSYPWAKNPSKELNESSKVLFNYLLLVKDFRNGILKEEKISNRNYILLLKEFISEKKITEEPETLIEPISSKTKSLLTKNSKEIVGYSDIKEEFEKLAQLIKSPQTLAKFGLPNIGGLLFYGPPGCGKTYWANWFAECLGLKLNEITRSDYASSYVSGELQGLTERLNKIAKDKPSVLFFDEFDDIGSQRKNNNAGDSENNKVVQFLLQQIPKLIAKGIIIIAATNFLKTLDTALIRGGRFDKKEPIFPPLPIERAELLLYEMLKVPSESPLLTILNSIGADEIDFWIPVGERMILFSNSYVLSTAMEIKRSIATSEEDQPDELSFLEIVDKTIDTISNSISLSEREDFKRFYEDLEENKFNKYPERIAILKEELDEFFGKGSHDRTPIGFKPPK